MSSLVELAEYLASLEDDLEARASINLTEIVEMAKAALPRTTIPPGEEATADDIGMAIHGMLGILKMLSMFEDLPFLENVERAIERYDTPGVRGGLVRALYPDWYANGEV